VKIKTIKNMIQNIVRHCTRSVYQQKINLFLNLNAANKSYFSTENTEKT